MQALLQLQKLSKGYTQSWWGKEVKWAVKDLDLTIQAGESWGIIGRNGAGKSTLLKLIGGITTPSSGKIIRRGTMASLIELGAGFHSDLSGMENLRFNASLLGMGKGDFERCKDEIIAFAGLEEVIYHPIRTYSSGMIMRLGFSMAAHVQTDLVLLDEVLAVGDSFFQQKCTEKILGMQGQGRTVVVVSHQSELIRRLCQKAAWLENGQLQQTGFAPEVLKQYLGLGSTSKGPSVAWEYPTEKTGFAGANWKNHPLQTGEKASLTLHIWSVKAQELDLGININDSDGRCLLHFSNRFHHQSLSARQGLQTVEVVFDPHLIPGTYSLSLFLRTDDTIQDWRQNCLEMQVQGLVHGGYENPGELQGPVLTEFEITLKD